MDDHVELLVTVVLAAEGERAARSACRELVWQVDGRIVESADCSAEEPGCWAVTVRVPSEERTTHNAAAPLARAVRQFVRGLGPNFVVPTVSCEPPTAWTVLDDPDAVQSLVSGAERLLVEAWYGGDPYPLAPTTPNQAEDEEDEDGDLDDDLDREERGDRRERGDRDDREVRDGGEVGAAQAAQAEHQVGDERADHEERENREAPEVPTGRHAALTPEWPPAPQNGAGPAHQYRAERDLPSSVGCRLTLRVDVATSRSAGAEWQARALASRISRTATLAGITEHDGVLSVLVDLGTADTPVSHTVLTAVAALDRPGWSTLRWEGETAVTTWTAKPRPESGITELELSSSPGAGRRRH
jgi:hypothetical protein